MNRLLRTALHRMAIVSILAFAASPVWAQWGAVDTTFTPGFDGDVFTSWVQPDGKLLVSGFFTKVSNANRSGIARLNSDGNLDPSFNPGTGAFNTNLNQHATVAALALQSDGKVIAGGYFNLFNGVARNGIVRLNSDGSLDLGFNPIVDDIVVALALGPDGKVLLGGQFTTVNGVSRPYIARLNANGSLDNSFNTGAGPDRSVDAVALQADGKILVGGTFTTINGVGRFRIARLNADGSLDTTFDPGAGPDPQHYVVSVSLQPDGKVVIGDDFTTFAGVPRNYVARLNSDGSLDTSFQPNITLVNGGVLIVQVEVDGKVLVGGDYTTVDGVSRINLARLNTDGSLDLTFNTGTGPSAGRNQNPRVRGTAVQADGKVLVGGGFTKFDGVTVNYLARLAGDEGGAVQFASANYSVDENAGNASIAVRRTGGTNGSISVNYVTSDGSVNPATAGADYVAQAGAVVFGPGETNKVFSVPILRDSLIEGNETVNLTLGNPIGGVILGSQQTATLTIIDNTNSIANHPPVLAPISDQTIDEETLLTFTATATDPDGDSLTFSLDAGAPAGATNDPASGVFTWTPTEEQGPGTYLITMRVTDNGSQPMSDSKSFSVVVREVNRAPVLSPISDQTTFAGIRLTVTNSATDPDLPANILTFSLAPGAPAGATIDASSGVFTWTPPTSQPPSTNMVTVRVTDNGVPMQSAAQSFSITVASPPVIESVAVSGGNVTISWSAVTGRSYRVQFKPDLNSPTWSDLAGDIPATGSTATNTDNTISGSQRYYQVVLLP